MHRWAVLFGLAATTLLAGCGFVSFEDVSAKAPYSGYIGKHYRSDEPTLLLRISMDPDYGPTPSRFVVKALPGISGREVLSSDLLLKGTTFVVLRVMRCTDCYLDAEERVELIVRLTAAGRFTDTEVNVSTKLLGPVFLEDATRG